MPVWLYLLVSVVAAAYGLLWVRSRRARAMLDKLPSYPQLPFIGNMHYLFGSGENLFRRIVELSKISEERKQPFVFWFGSYPMIFCYSPEDVKVISGLVDKPYLYNFAKMWVGESLATASATIWKHTIKKLGGVFTPSVVESYQNVFNEQAQSLVNQLKGRAGGEPFDISFYLSMTTLEVVCRNAMGINRITDIIETSKYYEAFNRCMELPISRGMNILTHPDWIYSLTPEYRDMKSNINVFDTVTQQIIEMKKLERGNTRKGSDEETRDGKCRSYLDLLLDISETDPVFTEQQILWEVSSIIIAGQDTAATTALHIFLMIGSRPSVQAKLYEELSSIFGDSTRPVEKEDLARMEYCEAVINETLRMFPSVPSVLRLADKEIQLKSCRVPAGSICAINVWGSGRSKEIWGPDADEFIPERWLRGDVPRGPASFLAFSYGRRACIGKRYAMPLVKTIIAYCVRELEFSAGDSDLLRFKIAITLKAISGHLIQVKLRK